MASELTRWLAIAGLVAQLAACDDPTLNEGPDWVIERPEPPPVATATSASLEQFFAHQVGREARLGSDDPKRWAKFCSIQHACTPFKVLRHCDAQLSALDSFANPPTDREGQVVALRGTLSLAPLISTLAACEPKPHDPRRPCCNRVGCGALIQCGNTPVLLDRLGCVGDESRLCCDTPAFDQTVVATGKLVRIHFESGVEWQLNDPRLCVEAP